jgi:hypothetical protein
VKIQNMAAPAPAAPRHGGRWSLHVLCFRCGERWGLRGPGRPRKARFKAEAQSSNIVYARSESGLDSTRRALQKSGLVPDFGPQNTISHPESFRCRRELVPPGSGEGGAGAPRRGHQSGHGSGKVGFSVTTEKISRTPYRWRCWGNLAAAAGAAILLQAIAILSGRLAWEFKL